MILYFGNAPKGSVLIKKIDSITRAPLSDVRFFITDADGKLLGNANGYFTTDSAGTILLENLDPGLTVIAKEAAAKDGYILDDTPQTVKVKSGETVTLEFRNTAKGALIVQKYDSVTKEPLPGAEFKITTASGELVPDNEGLTSSNGLYVTDAQGQIVLSKLNPGTYVVTETKAPDNYKPDGKPQTVVVGPADTQTLSFYNEPLAVLTILKRDATTLKPLAKAVFSVKYGNGQAVGANNGRYTTDADGVATVTGIEPSATVIVTEETAPTGYIKDATPKTVVVRSGAANTLVFDNEASTTLIIRKFIEGTENEPLSGVAFKVVDGAGAAIGPDDGVYYTDKAGEIVLSGLEPGTTVIAREIKTVEGFVLDGTPQDILIKAGEAQ